MIHKSTLHPIKCINFILQKLNLPIVDFLRLRQKFIYFKIKRLIPDTIDCLRTVENWSPYERLGETTVIYVMWWTGSDTMPPNCTNLF